MKKIVLYTMLGYLSTPLQQAEAKFIEFIESSTGAVKRIGASAGKFSDDVTDGVLEAISSSDADFGDGVTETSLDSAKGGVTLISEKARKARAAARLAHYKSLLAFKIEGLLTGLRHAFLDVPDRMRVAVAKSAPGAVVHVTANALTAGTGGRVASKSLRMAIDAAVKKATKSKTDYASALTLSNIEAIASGVSSGLLDQYAPLVHAYKGARLNDLQGHFAWRTQAAIGSLIDQDRDLTTAAVLAEIQNKDLKHRRAISERVSSMLRPFSGGWHRKGYYMDIIAMDAKQLEKHAQQAAQPSLITKTRLAVKSAASDAWQSIASTFKRTARKQAAAAA